MKVNRELGVSKFEIQTFCVLSKLILILPKFQASFRYLMKMLNFSDIILIANKIKQKSLVFEEYSFCHLNIDTL